MEPSKDEERDRYPGDEAFSDICLAYLFWQLVISVGVVALTVYWVFEFKGGLDFEKDSLQSPNFHIILTIVGSFFCAQAILTYRVSAHLERPDLIVISFILRLCGIICIFIGFYVVHKDSHYEAFNPFEFSSLRCTHSFSAMSTCFLFCLHFVCSMLCVMVSLCCPSSTFDLGPMMTLGHETFERLFFFNLVGALLTGFSVADSVPLIPKYNETENILPVNPDSSAEGNSKLVLDILRNGITAPLLGFVLFGGPLDWVRRLILKGFGSHKGLEEPAWAEKIFNKIFSRLFQPQES